MAARPSRNTHRLAAILDNLPDGLLLIDATGTVINANARAVAAFGVSSASSLVGSALAELLPSLGGSGETPDGWPDVGQSRRVLARPIVGDPFGVEVTCSRVPWGSGEERLLVSLRYGTDSTAEAELVRTGRAAQAVLRSTEEAVCGVDRDGRVVLANPAAARLLGAKVSAIAGLDLHSMALHTRLDGTSQPYADSPIARTLRTGRRLQRRREIVWRADGSPVPVELSTAPMRDGSEIVGAVLAFTDVTEQVESERRRARLLETLTDEIAPALTALTADPAQAEALEGLRALVAEAIDYEYLMTGQVELDLVPAQLRDVVGQAVEAIRPLATRRGVELDVVIEAGELVCDAVRLGRTVGEVLRAAVEAAASGAVLQVGAAAGTDGVRIAITGTAAAATGPGDNPLLRWLRPGKASERGTDPDLALAQIVAEAHGGRFLLEVAPDATRSFVVELPTEPPASAVRSTRRHARGEAAPGTGGPSSADAAAAQPVAPPPIEAPQHNVTAQAAANGAVPGEIGPVRRPPHVLVWPRPSEALAAELSAQGASSVALDRTQTPAVAVPDGAGLLLIDSVTGRLGRRTLHDLADAATSAGLPVLLVVGLAEVESEDAVTDPADLLRAAAPGAGEVLRVLLIEPRRVLAAALRASLRRAGYEVVHVPADADAAAVLGDRPPDLVVRNLSGPFDGAVDGAVEGGTALWSGLNAKAPVPVVAYTSDDLTAGHEERLPAGTTLISLAPRTESAAVLARIAGLVLRLADTD